MTTSRKQNSATGRKGLGCLAFIAIPVIAVLIIGALTATSTPKGEQPEKIQKKDLIGAVNFDGAQFHITNQEDRDWEICNFILNSNYYYPTKTSDWYPGQKIEKIPAYQTVSIGAAQFTLKDGTRFNPFLIKPQGFSISCGNGFGYWQW